MARVRSHSGSTLKPVLSNEDASTSTTSRGLDIGHSIRASLSIHDEAFSREPVLFSRTYIDASGIADGMLVELNQLLETIEVRDFETTATSFSHHDARQQSSQRNNSAAASPIYLCIVKIMSSEQATKQPSLEVSVNRQIASAFNFVSRTQISVKIAQKTEWISSHTELSFRDAYLSRSDMWRLVSQELVGKTVYSGQKLSFLNSLKATIRSIRINGRHAPVAFFDNSTIPVFRSEAARYVIFIQMSREMWDFDSEGAGEILFNRVVNGFLPELFKRWSKMEVRHLVSIVMFGRLEYRRSDFTENLSLGFRGSPYFPTETNPVDYQDFYRVVVTDMASAQWATILEELKRDFRTFLRDVSLFETPQAAAETSTNVQQGPVKITGRLSGALKGNILEAINLAASQFSNDYIDRDLIRTGISTVVITAGSGVFDVDKDLLKLTSETLTNNGIGIDVVCLSKMPLHSVPLLRYQLKKSNRKMERHGNQKSVSPSSLAASFARASVPDMSHSPAFSSTNASVTYFSRFPSAFPSSVPQTYGYGIPEWIDLSYWSSEMAHENLKHRRRQSQLRQIRPRSAKVFVPRVRMYELQMMGLMEMGMAEIYIPYLNEPSKKPQLQSNKWNRRASRPEYSRSLSQSPELKRKSHGMSKSSQGQFQSMKDQQSTEFRMSAIMDSCDNDVFVVNSALPRTERPRRKSQKPNQRRKHNDDHKRRERSPNLSSQMSIASLKTQTDTDSHSVKSSVASSSTPTKRPRAPKTISYMLRGLAPIKASAITPELHVENVAALRPADDTTDGSSDETRPSLKSRIESSSRSSWLSSDYHDHASTSSRPSSAATKIEGSKPIKINLGGSQSENQSSLTKQLWKQQQQCRAGRSLALGHAKDRNSSDSEEKLSDASTVAESEQGSLPANTIPFVHSVNASNPLKKGNQLDTFGRWQHLYPKKPRAATVKWRSLCTPASVPLTTEDFPLKDDLEQNFVALGHVVRVRNQEEVAGNLEFDTHALFLEMISLRIAHGYQFVTGTRVAEAFEEQFADYLTICRQDAATQPKLVVVLAMANTIQRIELRKAQMVLVVKYVMKQDDLKSSRSPDVSYSPYVRTILADNYRSSNFRFQGFSEQYPWHIADKYLSGEEEKPQSAVEELRYWRARFVLLPVEPPVSTWKAHQADESDEEIHLLGIRALTQLWQKHRYITAHERRVLESRTNSLRSHDINPLEVKMETVNASELVAQELDKLSQIEEGMDQELTHLLPEPQKLDQESSMQKFATAMQGDKGIDIKARRWHWKLHPNCFHGEEFTNWLLHNVKNLNTREDAVDFGNELMKEGLFEHVSGRHKFKDGTYFYSIKPDFRAPRLEQNKSWFLNNRSNSKTVPPTPIAEQPSREASPLNIRTRSGSNIAQQLNAASVGEGSPSAEKKRKVVSLSRMIRVDVDPRNRSFLGRPEVVHVHYDRFHNPENCYHLELNWLNTTCKLVDDAIISWTNTAERYGLKLVEVPIAEAYDVPIAEPFRAPYRIKLAIEPPKQKPNGIIFNTMNFSASSHQIANASVAGKHFYQKAILKRSNFVLDFEAASEFPEGVDINYSWGKVDYKYTQFVHRSGVILAQILDDGDIILLANRLYNSRLANTKEGIGRNTDPRRDAGPHAHRPAIPPSSGVSMQASGIVGVNLASPSVGIGSSPSLTPLPSLAALSSPLPRLSGHHPKPAIADSFGPKSVFAATGLWNTLITPEQIKDDLEAFCHDKIRLEQFYREVANTTPASAGPGSGSRKTTGSSSSSLLRPIREVPGAMASDITGMPAFELPEAVSAARELRRATVAYEGAIDLLDRTKIGSRSGSVGSGNETAENGRNSSVGGLASPLRKATK